MLTVELNLESKLSVKDTLRVIEDTCKLHRVSIVDSVILFVNKNADNLVTYYVTIQGPAFSAIVEYGYVLCYRLSQDSIAYNGKSVKYSASGFIGPKLYDTFIDSLFYRARVRVLTGLANNVSRVQDVVNDMRKNGSENIILSSSGQDIVVRYVGKE